MKIKRTIARLLFILAAVLLVSDALLVVRGMLSPVELLRVVVRGRHCELTAAGHGVDLAV